MRLTLKFAAMLAVACATLLAGCSKSIDFRQVHEIRGLIYKLNDNDPFTGTVTNQDTVLIPLQAVICDTQVKKGVLHGTSTCKTQAGVTVATMEYVEGKKHGSEKQWDAATKNLKIHIRWTEGRKDGVQEHYNPNTQKIVSRITWSAGRQEGEEKGWDVLGDTLLVDLQWRDGKATGYRKSGASEDNFKDGKRHGIQRYYSIPPDMEGEFTKWNPLIASIGGGGYAYAMAKEAVVFRETVYEDGVHVKTNVDVAAQRKAEDEAQYEAEAIAGKHGCIKAWTAAFHKEKGRNEPVYPQHMNEWMESCAENRLPAVGATTAKN